MANEKKKRERIIGIDLGTSNSAAAAMMGGRPVIVPSAEGSTQYGKAFPSYVAFTEDGNLLVGEPARRQAVSNPEATITAIKRKMGQDYKVKIFGKEYSPQQISAFILQKIKRDAEAFLGEKVKKAVITVPAYFNDNQRQATKDAGIIAGLDVVRIINEPTAASLAFGIDKMDQELKILVFDFGGGTLDVTIMDFGQNAFLVESTSGDTQLGGTDMDNVIAEYIVNGFKNDSGINLSSDATAMQRVREAGEKAKIELSTVLETEINLPFIAADESGPKNLRMKMTRSTLERLVNPIIERCRGPTMTALQDAKLQPNQIDKVILVGGPTRMPIVNKFIKEIFGKEAERGIDPMECVAIGAAIQGGIMAGEVDEIVLLDVTPLSLGVETLGGVFTRVMDKNTTIPAERKQIFSTAADFQTSVTINVLQGERQMAADNVSLGMFNLVGIPPAPRNVPQIEVKFDIDENGILNVTAKDLGTGKEQSITITASTKLDQSEINRMVKEAEQFAEQDKQKKEEVEVRNNADSMIYTSEKTLADLEDKLAKEQKDRIRNAVNELNEALKGEDISQIQAKTEALAKILQEIGTAVYQQVAQEQAAQQPPPGSGTETTGTSPPPPGEKVVDADYEVVDDE